MHKINIQTNNERYKTTPDLYGLFFEDINRSADGGLYPEMLRNRAFEDSIDPAGCKVSEDRSMFVTEKGWRDQFQNGEGLDRWIQELAETPVPAWYARNAEMKLDPADTLNKKRLAALHILFSKNGSITNIGFNGISLKKNDKYLFYMFAKATHKDICLSISICSAEGKEYDKKEIMIETGVYKKYEIEFLAAVDDFDARFVIQACEAVEVKIGFTSMMPAETYKGHGMRMDLMEMLNNSNSKFLRFPGGCIVEGFNKPAATRFSHTIGPVWERPSQMLMWHYRATNGLGFHEYLQICEDLNLEAMYVINCGMTCQGRAPEVFEGEELDEFLQEAFDAIEYATGAVNTAKGNLRAKAGHPEPFNLKYIEIGNENHGPEYFERYKLFYDALKERYPDFIYISNTHTEEQGLPTEVVDEHIYSTADYFATNIHMYDENDRDGAKIFIGEYAVTAGNDVGNLRAALSESMFLMGAEENQDVVTLTAYAPLFQNVNYTGWIPNLVPFDNHSVYGIPTYHALSMLGKNRGEVVVESQVETEVTYATELGLPGFSCFAPGVAFRNPRLDGKDIAISRTISNGADSQMEHTYVTQSDSNNVENSFPGVEQALAHFYCFAFEENMGLENVFELEIKAVCEQGPITLSIWNNYSAVYYNPDETVPKKDNWSPIFLDRHTWTIQNGKGSVGRVHWMTELPIGEEADVPFIYGEFNRLKIVTYRGGFDCYVNEQLVQSGKLPTFPAISAVAATDLQSVIIKVVNFSETDKEVEISLDVAIKSDFEVEVLAHPDEKIENSLENPLAIVPVTKKQTGAAQHFMYIAPAWSLNILRLKKTE